MAKLKASRLAVSAASEAVQIHGGVGYMLESPVARFYCDAKVLEIGEGTNEIQHLVIARALGCWCRSAPPAKPGSFGLAALRERSYGVRPRNAINLSCGEAPSETLTAGPHTPGSRSIASIGVTTSTHSVTRSAGSVAS
jgi:acyl-CoA dehydrogenase-like protein